MTCKSCGDFGICVIFYEDNSTVYAICLCLAGEHWRRTQTFKGERTDPLWHVWAHQHGVPYSKIRMLEDAVTPEELQARGFTELSAAGSMDAIAAAARSRKVSR